MTTKFEDRVDLLLGLLEERAATKSGIRTRFRELEPFGLGFNDDLGPVLFDPDFASGNDVDWTQPLGLLTRHTEFRETPNFQATQVRIASLAELRGKGKILTPRVVALDLAWFEDDGRTSTETLYFSFITGQWKMIWPRDVGTIDFAGKLKLLTQVQFERRYLWRAVIGTPSAPSISFNTDSEGARKLFKLRDVPEGKERRPYIRDWISEHWRTKPSNPEDSIRVREHLRGRTQFTWCGYQVSIIPSPFDLEKNEK
jgi:hypothetical protein